MVLPARSTTEVRFDAAWWNGLDRADQLVAVQGSMTSYQAGYRDGMTFGLGEGRIGYAQTDKLVAKFYPMFSHTIGFYASAISDFYARNPKSSSAEIGGVMGCLTDRNLESCEAVAKQFSE
jgi:hypothetical protein